MKLLHALTLLAFISLASCASAPKINVAQGSGGQVVSIPNRGISVALPTGWQLAATQPADTLVLAGAEGSALRFALVSPSGKPKSVESASFQKGVRDALAENGFTKLTRAELLNLSGANAFFCAGSASGKSESVMQVHLVHRGRPLLLVFYSSKKPVTQVASIKAILSSFQLR